MTGIAPQQLNPALISQAKKMPDLDMKRIDETAQDFEAMFLSEMLKPMFESVKVNEMFGGGKTEEIFSGFLRDEYTKMFSQQGGVGIAALVKEQLIEMQSRAKEAALAQNMHGNAIGTTGDTDAL
ncbi:MAG TPA: rod-binding protein [Micavibrio sp.]|nr:rod-binding protein [Micavibrio sp.]